MRVVHYLHSRDVTHYIGRPSIYGNPFKIDAYNDRDTVIRQYETYARVKPRVLAAIRSLPEDAVLGCWCYPKSCHGDVIIKFWKEMHGK